jgi:hypothetical protein
MNHDYAQRRRVAIAAAITVILVPAAFLLSRGGDADSGESDVTVVGTLVGLPEGQAAGATSVGVSPTSDPTATDALGTAAVAYLDGTAPPADDDPATIAIPRVGESIKIQATFRRSIDDPGLCQVYGVPYHATVTITNLDNSRSISCVASIVPLPDQDAVMSADAFLQLADLTDAPVPVEITW